MPLIFKINKAALLSKKTQSKNNRPQIGVIMQITMQKNLLNLLICGELYES